VILPTFNRKTELERALHSVFAQRGPSFEVLVVDDGSTEPVASWLPQAFASVRLIRQENAGPAAARNRGAAAAQGRWIAFLDSDDEWLPGKIAAQIDFFHQHPQLRIAQTEEIWIRHGRRVNPMNKHRKEGGLLFERSLDLCLISPSAVMIRRDLFEETGGFDESYPACEDYELWLRITAREAVGLIETPYVTRYGGHADQRSREFPAMDRFRIRAMLKLLRSGGLKEEQRAALIKILASKTRIFLLGAQKRGRHQEAGRLAEMLEALDQQRIPEETLVAGCLAEATG